MAVEVPIAWCEQVRTDLQDLVTEAVQLLKNACARSR